MLDKLCRACMTSEDEEDKLFEEFNEKDENFKQFIQLTSITIEKLKICENCQIELLNAIKFRSKCIDSDKRIRENYNIPTTPKFEENSSTKKYLCEYCDKCFTRSYNLQRHYKVHRKKILKISEICTDINDNSDEIKIQNLNVYGNDLTDNLVTNLEKTKFEEDTKEISSIKKKFGCQFCDKYFTRSNSLKRHYKLHTKEILKISIEIDTDLNDNSDEIENDKTEELTTKLGNDIEFLKSTESENFLKKKKIDLIDDPKDENFFVGKGHRNENEIEVNEHKKISLDCENITIEKPNPKNKRRKLTSCPVCNKTFERKYRLARHLNNVHDPKKPYECDYDLCKIRFQTEYGLKRHKLSHTPNFKKLNEFYQCPDCSSKFEKIEALSTHRLTHKKSISEEKFVCDICLKVFDKRNLLTRHSQTHEENKHWQCKVCDKCFTIKSKFVEHSKITHQVLKPFTCTICHKGFAHPSGLKVHTRIHSREKPYLCYECGKRFKGASELRQHVNRHKGIKRFVCNQCPAKFVENGRLQAHLNSHTGEKPYSCDLCSSNFKTIYALKLHKRIHTGEKPLACLRCPKRFLTSNHLRRHNRIHTGEKPYECTFCERAFSQSNDLVKHLRSHVGEKVYQCKLCPSAFRLHFELKKHQVEHFKQNDESAVNNFEVINSFNAHLFFKTPNDIKN